MASDTSLVFNVLAVDRASSVFRKVRRAAEDGSSGIQAAFGPALVPIFAASTAGAAGLAGALAGAGAAVAVFGGVLKTAFTEVKEGSDKTKDLRDKIALLNEQIKVANETGIGDAGKLEQSRIKATNELIARYQQMPPALRNVTMAYDGMKASWQGFVDQNKPAVYSVMTTGFGLLSTIIPKLQPLLDVATAAAGRLITQIAAAAGGGGFDRLVSFLTGQAGPAINNVIAIAKNLGTVAYNELTSVPQVGQGILSWLAEVTGKWAAWSAKTGEGGLQDFMAYAMANGPGVAATLGSLATAAIHIAQAVSPLAPISMAVAQALAAIIAALPPGVITVLVSAWVAYAVALKAYSAYVLIVGVAVKAAAAAQWLWRAAIVASNFVVASAQIATYLGRVVAVRVATMAMAVATRVWAATQWLLNVAMTANPIGLIIAAVVALIAVIVLVATKTKFFQTIWAAVWGFMKGVGAWFAGPFANFFVNAWAKIIASLARAKSQFLGFINFVKSAPGKMASALRNMFAPLWNGFRGFINKIIGGWNRLSFGIPGFKFAGISVPGISVGTPDIPYLAKGGNITRSGAAVVGERGPELVSLSRGAQVTPLGRGRDGGVVITIDPRGGDSELARMIAKMLRTQPAFAASVKSAIG